MRRISYFNKTCHTPHRSWNTNNYFKSKNIQVLEWPWNYPYINPIKNIWAYLKHAMQQITCNSKKQLRKTVQHHWYSLNRNFCQNPVKSMPKRVKSVITMTGYLGFLTPVNRNRKTAVILTENKNRKQINLLSVFLFICFNIGYY